MLKAARKQSKAKPLTLEHFAAAIQKDFQEMRQEMTEGFRSVAAEFSAVRKEMASKAELRELREDVQRITDTMATRADLAALREELLFEMNHGQRAEEIRELRDRLTIVEEKLGIKPTHRTA